MASKDEILELVPHYIAIIIVVLFVMAVVRSIVGEQHVLVEFAVILVLVFSYRPILLRLDFVPTPTLWERSGGE